MPKKRREPEATPETPRHWSVTEGRYVAGEQPYEPRIAPSRAVWLMAVWRTFATMPKIPTAKEAAGIVEAIPGDKPHDLPMLMDRLRAWPEGQPYPLLPDDEALSLRVHRRAWFDSAAWTPGSVPGEWRKVLLLSQEAVATKIHGG